MAGRPGDHLRDRYAQVSAAIHAVSFSDDHLAPRAAADALLEFYPCAVRTRQHIEPHEISRRSVGHFGYFREQVAGVLWSAAATHLHGG
jgi:predicted alpha/beta hydrolase